MPQSRGREAFWRHAARAPPILRLALRRPRQAWLLHRKLLPCGTKLLTTSPVAFDPDVDDVSHLLYAPRMRSATFPPIRVEPEVRAEVEAVLRDGETLTQFIEEAVVAAAAWRRSQAEFVKRGETAIERWRREGGGYKVDDVMADLQARLDSAKDEATRRPKL